jgi:hypothetical protein
MKKVIPIVITLVGAIGVVVTVAILVGVLCGCAVVRVSTPQWSATAGSLFKNTELKPITVATNGTLRVEGYKSGVDGKSLGEAVGTAGKVLLKP